MTEEKILLHCCCAPCTTSSEERIRERYQTVLFFYNPNIEPQSEYDLRLAEMQKLAQQLNVPLIVGEYDNEAWHKAIADYEDAPEGGERCRICFRFRLEETLRKAKELGIGFHTSTLSVSPWKNSKVLFSEAASLDSEEIKFIEENFKKQDGYKRSIELSTQFKLYRQNYCGCQFSKR
jgi:predicted adenine nucleotide alpha hydrolase (AANH) superfamily ATPase